MRSSKGHIETEKIVSLDTVISELTSIDLFLPKNNLTQFLIFNKAYLTVTKKIRSVLDKGYFENPKFIDKFSANFASHYFNAINDTLDGNKDLPVAWSRLNHLAKNSSTPTFILLLTGANAHINHDLPVVLLELIDKKKTEDLLTDVLKIDKILMKSGREIVGLFKESNSTLNFLKRHFIFLYYRPAMYMILYWRVRAWRNYRLMKKVGKNNSNYQRYSIRVANRFMYLARFF